MQAFGDDAISESRGPCWDEPPESHVPTVWQFTGRTRYHRPSPGADTVASIWNLVPKFREEALVHSPLYLDIVEDGTLVLDRNGFFGKVLSEMRERMRALGSRRVHLDDGAWYWDPKPDFLRCEVVEI